MNVIQLETLRADQTSAAWPLYHNCFAGLNAHTVMRHLLYRDEFDSVMADPRIRKYLAVDNEGMLLGLSTYTNNLSAWPLVSPEYFQRRWPRLYAEGRIWYCGFVACETERASPAFGALVEAMYRTAEAHGGVIGLDISRFNDEQHRMTHVINLMLGRISGGQALTELADTQLFMIYQTGGVPA